MMKSLMFFCLFFQANVSSANSKTIAVSFLTHTGSRTLKTWTSEDIQKFIGKNQNDISAQKFIFDESTRDLVLSDRASIDLVTFTVGTGANEKKIRVPRFLIWRGIFGLKWNSKTEELSSVVKKFDRTRLLVPADYFVVNQIQKIELSDHIVVYPQTKLQLRTNPAASRGEKIFTQSCLACHGNMQPAQAANKCKKINLDARSERGLIAYIEALELEKNKVKTK